MLESCIEKMARSDLRETATRRSVLRILHETAIPLAAPDIVLRCHAAGRPANKTTIYRDLVSLERAGVIRRVILSDRKQHFELTERGHHHHFVCLECDRVEDILVDEHNLEKQATHLAQQKGFSVYRHSLEFFGLCKMCT